MLFYLSATHQALSSIFVQETDKIKRHVYFLRKMFKGTKALYQKIKKLALVVVVKVRKLQPYIHMHKVIIK